MLGKLYSRNKGEMVGLANKMNVDGANKINSRSNVEMKIYRRKRWCEETDGL